MSNATAADAAAPTAKRITSVDVQAHARVLIEDGWAWLQANWLQILIAAAVGTVIVVALHALRRLAMRLCERPDASPGWGMILGRAAARTGGFFMIMVAARLVAGYADAPPAVLTTIRFLFTVAAVFQAAMWAREIILGAIEYRTQASDHAALGSALGIIRLLVTFALFAIALIVVLDNLGVNVTGLVAGLGVGGIAIGLAAQGIFADLFAALAIIFDRPFRVGEVIGYDSTTGTVERIGLKSTRLRAQTGEQRVIANKTLLDKEIQNITERQYRRVIFTLGLVQWTKPEVLEGVPALLEEVVTGAGETFTRAGFVKFGDSSYDFQLEFDTGPSFADWFGGRHKVAMAIIKRFNADGIELAYPTQTGFTAGPEGGLVPPYPTAAKG